MQVGGYTDLYNLDTVVKQHAKRVYRNNVHTNITDTDFSGSNQNTMNNMTNKKTYANFKNKILYSSSSFIQQHSLLNTI